jgi:drug/metabolite transporter (DMT)-like permease
MSRVSGSRTTGYLLVGVSAVLWGLNGPASRITFDSGIEPRALAGWRVIGAALLLCGGLLVADRASLRPHRAAWRPLALFGLIGVSLGQLFYFEAIKRFDVALTLVIVFTAPLWVALFRRVAHGVRQGPVVWLGMLVAIVGVATSVLGRSGGVGKASVAGLILAAMTAFAYAAQLILAGGLPLDVRPPARVGLSMLVAAPVWLVLPDVRSVDLGLLATSVRVGPHLPFHVPIWLLVAYVIVGGTVVPYMLLVMGVGRIGPTAAGVTGTLEPIVAAVLGYVVLAQQLNIVQVGGIVLVLVAVVVAERARVTQTAGDAGEPEVGR